MIITLHRKAQAPTVTSHSSNVKYSAIQSLTPGCIWTGSHVTAQAVMADATSAQYVWEAVTGDPLERGVPGRENTPSAPTQASRAYPAQQIRRPRRGGPAGRIDAIKN